MEGGLSCQGGAVVEAAVDAAAWVSPFRRRLGRSFEIKARATPPDGESALRRSPGTRAPFAEGSAADNIALELFVSPVSTTGVLPSAVTHRVRGYVTAMTTAAPSRGEGRCLSLAPPKLPQNSCKCDLTVRAGLRSRLETSRSVRVLAVAAGLVLVPDQNGDPASAQSRVGLPFTKDSRAVHSPRTPRRK